MKKINQSTDPFNAGSPTFRELDAAIYGEVDMSLPASGSLTASPIPLMDITPDPTQPRRIIPVSVRGQWDGTAEGIPRLLAHWHRVASMYAPEKIDLAALLTGRGEPMELAEDSSRPVLIDYLELISLAASIKAEGLTNPITVTQTDNHRYLIETGERRYLAHWLLRQYVDEAAYGSILAYEVEYDVWRQASENGARKPLNAIGMARQLAKLVMSMYADDATFQPYSEMVQDGCDRAFFAQVADGNVWRIKRGMGQRVLDVTGLKSSGQIRQYRLLLSIPDEVWQQADDENWPEFRVREHVAELAGKRDTSTAVDISPEKEMDTVTTVTVWDDEIEQNGSEASVMVTVPEWCRIGSFVRMIGSDIVYEVTDTSEYGIHLTYQIDGHRGSHTAQVSSLRPYTPTIQSDGSIEAIAPDHASPDELIGKIARPGVGKHRGRDGVIVQVFEDGRILVVFGDDGAGVRFQQVDVNVIPYEGWLPYTTLVKTVDGKVGRIIQSDPSGVYAVRLIADESELWLPRQDFELLNNATLADQVAVEPEPMVLSPQDNTHSLDADHASSTSLSGATYISNVKQLQQFLLLVRNLAHYSGESELARELNWLLELSPRTAGKVADTAENLTAIEEGINQMLFRHLETWDEFCQRVLKDVEKRHGAEKSS